MSNAAGVLILQDIRQLRKDGPVGVEAEKLTFVKQPNHPEAEILRGRKSVGENNHNMVSARPGMILGLSKKSGPVRPFQKMQTTMRNHEIVNTIKPVLSQIANACLDGQMLSHCEGSNLCDCRMGNVYCLDLAAVTS